MSIGVYFALTVLLTIDADAYYTVISPGDFTTLNCASDETLQINAVHVNSTACNTNENNILQNLSVRCNGKISCGFNVTNALTGYNTTCLINGTTVGLQYYCKLVSDSYYTVLSPGQFKTINCTSDETLQINAAHVNSTACNTSENNILQNLSVLCNGKVICGINVTNALAGYNTTCLTNGITVGLQYYCKRDGGWTFWSNFNQCSVTCGGGIQRRSRTCTNPSPNVYGQNCTGNNTDQQACNVFNCSRDGGWSSWSTFNQCSVTCGGGFQRRTRNCTNPLPIGYGQKCTGNTMEQQICNAINCSNPYSKEYKEDETALLTCSEEFNETIQIASVNYNLASCIHKEKYGIANLCTNKNACFFDVTNNNVGSSCGANGTASLQITYNCIRNGGWTNWNSTTTCSSTCGGGIQNVTRACTNPSPNELGADCDGETVIEQDCSNYNCFYEHFACIRTTFNATCRGGYIEFNKAIWETSYTCGTYITYTYHDVTPLLQTDFNIRRSASFYVDNPTFHVSCVENNKMCSRLSYIYTCFKTQWSSWSTWSVCSGTCGSGSQFRNRSCINAVNTTDGYTNECVGESYVLRECNIPCLTCENQYFNLAGTRLPSLNKDNSTGTGYLLTDKSNTISCCGRIHQWEFVPVNIGTIIFVVWRKIDTSKYKIVGTNQINVTVTNQQQQTKFTLPEDKKIAVKKGDIIGWHDGGNNIIGYYDCLHSSKMCPISVLRETLKEVRDRDEIDIELLTAQSNRIYALSYYTSGNRVPSKPAISTATVADNVPVDSKVVDISLTDPDYGDIIQNIQLDYTNEYFYFDTEKRSIHVKKRLPHTPGIKYTVHSYVFTVEDSCYNQIVVNVTVLAKNSPPLFMDLPNVLRINPKEMNSTLTTFRLLDPSNDNIFCIIANTSATSGIFRISQNGFDAMLVLSENASINVNITTEYNIEISCDDGTETSAFPLTVLFTSDTSGVKPTENPDNTGNIIGGVIGGFCGILIFVIAYLIRRWRRKSAINKPIDEHELAASDAVSKPNEYSEVTIKQNEYIDMSEGHTNNATNEKLSTQSTNTPDNNPYHQPWR